MNSFSRSTGFKLLFTLISLLVIFSQVSFISVRSTQTPISDEQSSQSGYTMLDDSGLVYGPKNGDLWPEPGQSAWFEPKVNLVDFTAEVTFYNPYSIEKGGWDYGIAFRGNSRKWMLLSITSNAEWILQCGQSDYFTYPDTGRVNNIDLGPTGRNRLKLVASGKTGDFYVNDKYVSSLDLSCSSGAGDVSLSAGYKIPGISGISTHFTNFTIKSNDIPQSGGNGSSKSGSTNIDSDQDGIDDTIELRIARKYSPVLEFDENETEDVKNTLLPLYQVSPIKLKNGNAGAILTFVFLYDNDYGADFDQGWKDWFTDPLDTIGGHIMDPFDQFFGKHCGDTEVIYFYIANYGDWQNTKLEGIFWKRHYDPIYETSENVVEYEDIGDGNERTHPVIYVSEDKHGMYPSHKACENYQTDVVEEKIKDTIIFDIPITPKMEDCSDGVRIDFSNLVQQLNVGEAISESTMNRTALNGTIFEGYDPWENVDFLGRTDYDKLCVVPAGGLGGKWCGNPFSTGSDHPCNNDDWYGMKQSSGYCINYNTNRYGSDFDHFNVEGSSAEPCAYACFFDSNCVSWAYVLPAQGSTWGTCWLKNFAPKPFFLESVASGLSQDCYSMNWVPPED